MPGNLAYRAYQFIWKALDWLYPPECGGCGQPGSRWCENCSATAQVITPPICPICGNPSQIDQVCPRCLASPPAYTALRAYAVFQGSLRQAVHGLKYRRNLGLGEALAQPVIETLQMLNWPLDIVTSVPLGLVRFRERGYNQATLLARPIAYSMGLPFSEQVLSRTRETPSQVGLTVMERQANMVDAFQAAGKSVRGKNILVVDDVATSGATLNACARALLEGGASQVYGFSLARAVFKPNNEIDIA